MPDKITKALRKLTGKEKQHLKIILEKIQKANFDDLDIKKLKGNKNIYRVRLGKLRIIFQKIDRSIKILAIERRKDTTYKKF